MRRLLVITGLAMLRPFITVDFPEIAVRLYVQELDGAVSPLRGRPVFKQAECLGASVQAGNSLRPQPGLGEEPAAAWKDMQPARRSPRGKTVTASVSAGGFRPAQARNMRAGVQPSSQWVSRPTRR